MTPLLWLLAVFTAFLLGLLAGAICTSVGGERDVRAGYQRRLNRIHKVWPRVVEVEQALGTPVVSVNGAVVDGAVVADLFDPPLIRIGLPSPEEVAAAQADVDAWLDFPGVR